MAWLKGKTNTVYVFVKDESLTSDVEISTHPVEQGINITDTVKKKAPILSISGKIVAYTAVEKDKPIIVAGDSVMKIAGFTIAGGSRASVTLQKKVSPSHVMSALKTMKDRGELITYEGRNFCKNMQIKSFSTSHPNTTNGGADFEMELQECRIALNAYVAPKLGESNVKNGGNQQVNKGENKEVWYEVKKGDCVWALVVEKKVNGKWVDADYKNLKREGAESGGMGACNWVMEKNPTAFSRKGDFRTLQIGKKILLGMR